MNVKNQSRDVYDEAVYAALPATSKEIPKKAFGENTAYTRNLSTRAIRRLIRNGRVYRHGNIYQRVTSESVKPVTNVIPFPPHRTIKTRRSLEKDYNTMREALEVISEYTPYPKSSPKEIRALLAECVKLAKDALSKEGDK